jgi:hypothetical protein
VSSLYHVVQYYIGVFPVGGVLQRFYYSKVRVGAMADLSSASVRAANAGRYKNFTNTCYCGAPCRQKFCATHGTEQARQARRMAAKRARRGLVADARALCWLADGEPTCGRLGVLPTGVEEVTTQASMGPRPGIIVAYFDDKEKRFQQAAEILAQSLEAPRVVGITASIHEAFATMAMTRRTTLVLIGHGSKGAVGPENKASHQILLQDLLSLLIKKTPHVSALVVIACHAGDVVRSLHEKWLLRSREERLTRPMGMVGVGNGPLLYVDPKKLSEEYLERCHSPSSNTDMDAEGLALMGRIVASRLGGVPPAVVAMAKLLSDLHDRTIGSMETLLAQVSSADSRPHHRLRLRLAEGSTLSLVSRHSCVCRPPIGDLQTRVQESGRRHHKAYTLVMPFRTHGDWPNRKRPMRSKSQIYLTLRSSYTTRRLHSRRTGHCSWNLSLGSANVLRRAIFRRVWTKMQWSNSYVKELILFRHLVLHLPDS